MLSNFNELLISHCSCTHNNSPRVFRRNIYFLRPRRSIVRHFLPADRRTLCTKRKRKDRGRNDNNENGHLPRVFASVVAVSYRSLDSERDRVSRFSRFRVVSAERKPERRTNRTTDSAGALPLELESEQYKIDRTVCARISR